MRKILIISGGLHYDFGTGVTLANLFQFVDKNEICILSDSENALRSYRNGYKNILILGKPYTKPFYESNKKNIYNLKNKSYGRILKPILKKVKSMLFKFGLYNQFSNFKIDETLKQWLIEQKPTSIYTLGKCIQLSLNIKEMLGVPLVLHIMDDWVSTEIKPSLLSFFWKHKLNNDFRKLISKSSFCLAISDKMASEYYKRYGVQWKVFHNPLKVNNWIPYQKKNYSVNGTFKLAYLGLIKERSIDIVESLSNSVTKLGKVLNLELHIYSQLEKQNSPYVHYYPFLPFEKLPQVMASYDLLLIPLLSSSKLWNKYVRLSMPTKLSEFLITGVPVWVISAKDSALYEFCASNSCAFYSDSLEHDCVASTLTRIINDESARERVTANAKEVALNKFNSDKVAKTFSALFS